MNVGETGRLGETYQLFYDRYEVYLDKTGKTEEDVSFMAYISMNPQAGDSLQDFLNMMENEIEGDNNDNLDNSTLNFSEHLQLEEGAVFQSNDGEAYTEIDWETGNYSVKSGEQLANAFGLSINENTGKMPYDIIDMDCNSLEFIDYSFEGLNDGADTQSMDLSQNTLAKVKGDVSWSNKEIDIETEEGLEEVANIMENQTQWDEDVDFEGVLETRPRLFIDSMLDLLKEIFDGPEEETA